MKKALHLLASSALSIAVANATWAQSIDSDNDGVSNDYDQCAGTPAGTPVNSKAEVALLLDIDWNAPTYAGSITSESWGGLDQTTDQWAVKLVMDDFDLDNDGTVSEQDGDIAIDIISSTSLPVGTSPATGHIGLASGDYAAKSTSAAEVDLFDALRLEDNVRGTANHYPGWSWSFTRRMYNIMPEGSNLKENDIINALATQQQIAVSERFQKSQVAQHEKFGTATIVAASFANAGCAPFEDTDNDGIVNPIDQCPSTPAGATVNPAGCKLNLDSDQDGVPDSQDLCPNSEAPYSVDADGCAMVYSALIEAEDYTSSYDTTAGNTGGEYRSDDTDIQAATDVNGGYNIGWTEAGETLEYSVSLSTATYEVTTRVASAISSGSYKIYLDDQLVGGTTTVASTGGWQSWASQKPGSITVSAGEHTLRVEITGGGLNLNWIELAAVEEDDNSNTPAFELQIEAEDYSYQSGVETENTSDVNGGLNVGWTDAGDWMSYHSIDIPESGNYLIEYRVASDMSQGASFKLEQSGGGTQYGTISVPNTGGWQNWQTVSHTVSLNAGVQDLAISAIESGWNINWIKFTLVD